MIDVLVLLLVAPRIARLVQAKGLRAAKYVFLTCLLWVVFEGVGLLALWNLGGADSLLGRIVFAVGGGFIGVGIGFAVARLAKPAPNGHAEASAGQPSGHAERGYYWGPAPSAPVGSPSPAGASPLPKVQGRGINSGLS